MYSYNWYYNINIPSKYLDADWIKAAPLCGLLAASCAEAIVRFFWVALQATEPPAPKPVIPSPTLTWIVTMGSEVSEDNFHDHLTLGLTRTLSKYLVKRFKTK